MLVGGQAEEGGVGGMGEEGGLEKGLDGLVARGGRGGSDALDGVCDGPEGGRPGGGLVGGGETASTP